MIDTDASSRDAADTIIDAGADQACSPPWDLLVTEGPVLVTAIHAGHTIRPSLQSWLALDEAGRLREEEPLTDYFLLAGDTVLRANRSRFECDLNRPVERCITSDPAETLGVRVWNDGLPRDEIEASRALHRHFYTLMAERVKAMINLVLRPSQHRGRSDRSANRCVVGGGDGPTGRG